MKAIFISDNGRYHRKISFNVWINLFLPFLLVCYTFFLVYTFYEKAANIRVVNQQIKMDKKIDYLSKKLATLEAQTQRLNALGSHISNKIRLDIQAFNLDKKPAQGGIDLALLNGRSLATPQIIYQSLVDTTLELEALEKQFNVFQKLSILKDKTEKQINFARGYSSPVEVGYISSSFGKRRDPINGKYRHHSGIDIAGIKGTAISSITQGVVTFSGKKGGYGNLVEIKHPNSLMSRYAHLETSFVEIGDRVKRGTIIATMGDTGRVTGTHLHLEVWERNKPVNPTRYLQSALLEMNTR